MPYRHLLVICDGGAEADAAVRAASEIANHDRARLTIAAVAEVERPSGCQMQTSTWNAVLRDAAESDLKRARGVVDSPAHFTVLAGEFSKVVARAASELGCDAIMLAPPPRAMLGRILCRDRAKALARRTSCPVLRPR